MATKKKMLETDAPSDEPRLANCPPSERERVLPNSNRVDSNARAVRRRRARITLQAQERRAQLDVVLKELLCDLLLVGVEEAPARGANLLVATAQLAALAIPAQVTIRVFMTEREVIMRTTVPRLRLIVTLPIDTEHERHEYVRAFQHYVSRRLA